MQISSTKAQLVHAVCEGLRPFLLSLPLGRVRVLGYLGGGQKSDIWMAHPRPSRRFFDRDLDAWVEVDLRDWAGRWHYFSGHYYEQDLPWVMRQMLRPGDCFVDVGANVGFHTLCAARLVTPQGRVVALEPSPVTWRRLESHLEANGLDWVERRQVALGDAKGEAVLHVDPLHLGTASLRNGMQGAETARVPVECLDDVVDQPEGGCGVLVKVDVEGFELRVLRGARRWRQRPRTLFVVEVTPDWIEAAGGQASELFELFQVDGYRAFRIERQRGRYGRAPRFIAAAGAERQQADYLFAREDELKEYPWLPQ